ncbi:uncharacterized protein LOC100741667 [Bombus impatiens]|uniref:Uncharacterized protein LOC100741667 n=1 Tax=Bombus impatiens TaxID=132113 RepID=A0A6P3DQU3_BOMIM|nr:uncharacterized protein LOC100741667 [Bombus impatiens]
MDLVYVPEILTYGYFRAPQYRDYEQPWNKDYFNCGKTTQVHSQRLPQQHHEQKALSKENCYLCRENKRRSLAAYIREKSRRNSCQEIHEEEEERDCTDTKEGITKTDKKTSKKVLENNGCIKMDNITKNVK